MQDLENFGPGFTATGTDDAVSWVVTATEAARSVLGPGPLITHAPQAPYFGPVGAAGAPYWTGVSGGYTAVFQRSSGAIDALLVQFYNQGGSCYTTYAGLFRNSASDCPVFPGTSLGEIANSGIPAAAIVVVSTRSSAVASSELRGWLTSSLMHAMHHNNMSAPTIGITRTAPSWAPPL